VSAFSKLNFIHGTIQHMTVHIDGLGKLSQDPDVPEWLISLPVPVPFFNTEELQFVFDEGLPEFGVSRDAVEAVRNFMALGEAARMAASMAVYQNYREYVQRNRLRGAGSQRTRGNLELCDPTANFCQASFPF
jgi:hypothetical protein